MSYAILIRDDNVIETSAVWYRIGRGDEVEMSYDCGKTWPLCTSCAVSDVVRLAVILNKSKMNAFAELEKVRAEPAAEKRDAAETACFYSNEADTWRRAYEVAASERDSARAELAAVKAASSSRIDEPNGPVSMTEDGTIFIRGVRYRIRFGRWHYSFDGETWTEEPHEQLRVLLSAYQDVFFCYSANVGSLGELGLRFVDLEQRNKAQAETIEEYRRRESELRATVKEQAERLGKLAAENAALTSSQEAQDGETVIVLGMQYRKQGGQWRCDHGYGDISPWDSYALSQIASWRARAMAFEESLRKAPRLEDVPVSADVPIGVYRVHWKDGGHSFGAVDNGVSGTRWISLSNWISGSIPVAAVIDRIAKLERIVL